MAIIDIESQQERDWKPLFNLVGRDFRAERGPGQFMFMGFAKAEWGTKIHLFKHANTRRYLNIDESGNCFLFDGRNGYTAISNGQALQWVFS